MIGRSAAERVNGGHKIHFGNIGIESACGMVCCLIVMKISRISWRAQMAKTVNVMRYVMNRKEVIRLAKSKCGCGKPASKPKPKPKK